MIEQIKLNGHKDILEFIHDHPKLSVDDVQAVLEAYAGEDIRFIRFKTFNTTAQEHKEEMDGIQRTAKGKMIDWLVNHGPDIDDTPGYVPPPILLFG